MSTITTITIKRPQGNTEIVDVSDKFRTGISGQMFETIKKATKAAGKGECLTYSVEHTISDERLAKLQEHDKKCKWFEKHGFDGNDIN